MQKTIGITAHVDAGKTTFSEQLLYHAKAIRERGRVDHKNAFLDSHLIERQRGITIFSDQASFDFNGSAYTMIDTPGHVDFSPEMERMIQVMDYAVLLISAADGIQGHTETVWRLLRQHRVPVFIFVNKMDREDADFDALLAELKEELSADICNINIGLSPDGAMSGHLAEVVAERDEALLETYFDTGYEKETWLSAMRRMVREGLIFPCAAGSALNDDGVLEFLEKLDLLTETAYDLDAEFGATVYKIRHDEKGNRLAYMKSLAGTVQVRDELAVRGNAGKVTAIFNVNGNELKPVRQAVAGELFAVSGIPDVEAGDGVGTNEERRRFELIPTLKAKVIHGTEVHVKDVLRIFHMLDREEPSLQMQWDEHFQAIHVHVMGVIQLEVLKEVIRERFGMKVEFGKPQILYKETIRTETVGYGHFEPLRHYAEVHLKLEPGARGSGIHFENACHPNELSIGYQNLVEQHVLERAHHGLLTGSALTDVKVTLLTGRGHQEHTSGGDFREATYRAIRQGLEKAENVLLEPYYDFRIKVDQDGIGRVLSDVQQASGTFGAPETVGEHVVVSGRVPVATFMDYPATFASHTHGKGMLSLKFGGYDICHDEAAAIAEAGYEKDADPEYTSSSIFCSKGAGYSVPWKEAEEKMHCL